jgi:hypothetical protein
MQSLPAAVDLTQYNPPVGDQGGVESCVSWATGYYLRGWYAGRGGYYPPGGFAPLFLYNQITHGQNVGTGFGQNLGILQQQGIDPEFDFWQGYYDYTDQPTTTETAEAAPYRIAGYSIVSPAQVALKTWIETTISAGNPVVIGIPVYPEFDQVGPATNYLVNVPQPGETSRGGHAVFGSKYDANGLWIENSWGTSWGKNGWAELSWNFISQYATGAANMVPSVVPANPSQGAIVKAAIVNGNGSIRQGSGFLVYHLGAGYYHVYFPAGTFRAVFNSTQPFPAPAVTRFGSAGGVGTPYIWEYGDGSYAFDIDTGGADSAFSFLVAQQAA